MAVSFNWKIYQIDVNNHFLNEELQEDVYMMQPKGCINSEKTYFVCKLTKALYGLKHASKTWFEKPKRALMDKGFTESFLD